MPTMSGYSNHQDYRLHDHAGARWLAPFISLFVVTIGVMIAMLVYPHVAS